MKIAKIFFAVLAEFHEKISFSFRFTDQRNAIPLELVCEPKLNTQKFQMRLYKKWWVPSKKLMDELSKIDERKTKRD